MKTVAVQIGNTDNALSQQDWHRFVKECEDIITGLSDHLHFSGGPANSMPWQNWAWIFECDEKSDLMIQQNLAAAAKRYGQDSIAWTAGETQFIIIP